MMSILGFVLFGFIVGLIARALMPGRDPLGLIGTTLLGVFGAVLGGWIGGVLGFYQIGDSAGYLAATLGAFVLLLAYNLMTRRRAPRLKSDSVDRDRQRPAA